MFCQNEKEGGGVLPPTDPEGMLADLLLSAINGGAISSTTCQWLSQGILAKIIQGGDLETHLGLRYGCGQMARLERRIWRVKCDAHLIDAALSVALDPAICSWERSNRLAEQIGKFLRTWPATQKLSQPPSDWPEVRQHLWRAAATGFKLPEGADAIYRMLVRNGGFSRGRNGKTILASFLPTKPHDNDHYADWIN